MKILISGFKAFNNENINPSLIIANKLKEKYLNIEVVELNVEYDNDSIKLLNKINEIKPDIIMLLGQAGGRSKVCLEQFALNMQSATISDNKGKLISHKLINQSGDNAYKSTINLNKIINDLKDDKLVISYHAGTFICNEIYYNTLHYLNANNLNTPCVFIHIPFIKEQIINKNNVNYLELDESYLIIYNVLEHIKNTLI